MNCSCRLVLNRPVDLCSVFDNPFDVADTPKNPLSLSVRSKSRARTGIT